DAYWQVADVENFAQVISNADVLKNNGNLSVQLYVKQASNTVEHNLELLISDIRSGQQHINTSLNNLFAQLKNIGIEV
ncbi:MAG: hypothetical protein KBD37_00005, partial [Burkholderiales bacterium]|nr:hypothetical protein [Burkholderiales bacterium]